MINPASTANTSKVIHLDGVTLCVSDVHLSEPQTRTTEFFLAFLSQHARQANHLILLGDLFEYWAGDDDMATPFHQCIVTALRTVREQGCQIYWMAGNRDFLVGSQFAATIGLSLLDDPSQIEIHGERIVLTHGDAQCTDDLAYMAFRQTVRQPERIKQFLSMPLAQRKTFIEGVRKESVQEQKGKSMAIIDVNPQAIQQLFQDSGCKILIHGHTHRPHIHQTEDGLRYVLPDWECDQHPEQPRGGWLSIGADAQIQVHGLDQIHR